MATIYQFICDNCEYEAQISGKPDMIMRGETIPVCCSNCNELSDSVQLFYPDGHKKPERSFATLCEDCNTESFEKWDYQKKQCPKCKAGTMKVDKAKGVVMEAD